VELDLYACFDESCGVRTVFCDEYIEAADTADVINSPTFLVLAERSGQNLLNVGGRKTLEALRSSWSRVLVPFDFFVAAGSFAE